MGNTQSPGDSIRNLKVTKTPSEMKSLRIVGVCTMILSIAAAVTEVHSTINRLDAATDIRKEDLAEDFVEDSPENDNNNNNNKNNNNKNRNRLSDVMSHEDTLLSRRKYTDLHRLLTTKAIRRKPRYCNELWGKCEEHWECCIGHDLMCQNNACQWDAWGLVDGHIKDWESGNFWGSDDLTIRRSDDPTIRTVENDPGRQR